MKTITVEVTQEDIDEGEVGRCDTCPVALALHRATGDLWRVGARTARREGDEWCAYLPAIAGDFILRFDYGANAAPFTFTLKVPE